MRLGVVLLSGAEKRDRHARRRIPLLPGRAGEADKMICYVADAIQLMIRLREEIITGDK